MSQSAAGSVQAETPRRRPTPAPSRLMHSGVDMPKYIATHALGAVFPMTAGIMLFGWRALGVIGLVLLCATGTAMIWRRIGNRGAQLRIEQVIWQAGLLALMLPAHLFVFKDPTGTMVWPIAAAAGVLLVIFMWALGGVGMGRVHPVLLTYLLLFVCFKELLVPQHVLQWGRMLWGDVLRSTPLSGTITQRWIRSTRVQGFDAVSVPPASQTLSQYTRGAETPQRAWMSLDALLRDRMPPLEDLLVGGHPAPIGSGSAVAVIIGGLFLLYRGAIDGRVPLITILSATIALLVLPVPVLVKEHETVWSWLAMRVPDLNSGWQAGVTLANYELLAGPLLFSVFFIATSPHVRPISRRARVAFALIAGILAAVLQLYVSVAIGPYLAILAAGVVAPNLDRFFKSRTLV